MKGLRVWFLGSLLAGFSLCSIAAEPLSGEFDIDKIPVGTVLMYEKSNLDGTNQGTIALYYQDELTLESFKWRRGNARGTLVKASFDPNSTTVKRFEAYHLFSDNRLVLNAVLSTKNRGEFSVRLGDKDSQVSLNPIQWHSYDFDFASLGFAYRLWDDKLGNSYFHIFDLNLANEPPTFEDFGRVDLSFKGLDEKHERASYRYSIDGPGLDDRGGEVWFDSETHDLLAFEIQKPDEPGYDSGRLKLKERIAMTPSQWQAFKISSLQH